MARLVVSLQAELDTAAIVTMLTEKAGALVAGRYRREFEELFERLIVFPMSGPKDLCLGGIHASASWRRTSSSTSIAVTRFGYCEYSTAVGTSLKGSSGND